MPDSHAAEPVECVDHEGRPLAVDVAEPDALLGDRSEETAAVADRSSLQPVDRQALVAELRRQAGYPDADRQVSWQQAFHTLADALDGTAWLAPVPVAPGERTVDSTALYGTTDAMVWAQAFCDAFNGEIVSTTGGVVDPGLLVGWFANYRHTVEQDWRRRQQQQRDVLQITDEEWAVIDSVKVRLGRMSANECRDVIRLVRAVIARDLPTGLPTTRLAAAAGGEGELLVVDPTPTVAETRG